MALDPIGTGAGVDVGPVQRISARDFPSPRIIRSEDAMKDDAKLSLYGIYPMPPTPLCGVTISKTKC